MKTNKQTNLTRRDFFKKSSLTAGLIVGAGALLGACSEDKKSSNQTQNTSNAHAKTSGSTQVRGRMFFTADEDFKTLSSAVERIFPKDDLGPGAIDLAVPYFIDNQLAGAYGNNAREYMQGPFFKGVPTQGYQTPMIRQEIFKEGISAIQKYSNKLFQKSFNDLEADKQDSVLKDFENNKVAMKGVDSSYFFSLLRDMTLAGVYADPIYNGNNNMDGWKLKEYPGAQMSYFGDIADKEFKKIPPVSLADMQNM